MSQISEQSPKPVKVSAVVVSCNRVAHLRRCLAALESAPNRGTMQIVVADNGSTDGSAALDDEFPSVRFIRLPRNFGLTRALNVAIRAATGDYVFFLHDDVEPAPDAASLLAERLDAEVDVAAVCPLLVTPDGDPVPQVRELPAPGAGLGPWRSAPSGEPIAVDYARGTALMVRRHFLGAGAKIDERYGLFGSDAELCTRIRRAGKKIEMLPAARAVHHSAPPPPGITSAMIEADETLGLAEYLAKYFGFAAGLRTRAGAILACIPRLQFSRLSLLVQGQKIDGTQAR